MKEQKLAEVARSYWDTEGRGDIDGVLDHFAESATFAAPGFSLKGHEEIRKFYEEIINAYASMRIEFLNTIETGDNLVVEFGFHYERHNGEKGYAEGCNVFTIIDGKIQRLRAYFNTADY